MPPHHRLLLLLAPFFALPAWSGERSPAPVLRAPAAHPGFVEMAEQRDPHTCGFHALSAVYRAYRLSPEAFRLRARLGVDRPAIPHLENSTGTLTPDLLRVVSQDGFAAELLSPAAPDFALRLDAHLSSQQLALALIKRRENGALHWVVFTKFENDTVEIADSLRPSERYLEPVADFATCCLQSVILLQPDPRKTKADILNAHRRGLLDMMGLSGGRKLWIPLFAGIILVCGLVFSGLVAITARLLRLRPAHRFAPLVSGFAGALSGLGTLAWFGYSLCFTPFLAMSAAFSATFLSARFDFITTKLRAAILSLLTCVFVALLFRAGSLFS